MEHPFHEDLVYEGFWYGSAVYSEPETRAIVLLEPYVGLNGYRKWPGEELVDRVAAGAWMCPGWRFIVHPAPVEGNYTIPPFEGWEVIIKDADGKEVDRRLV